MPPEEKNTRIVSRVVDWVKKSAPVMMVQAGGEHFAERLKNPKQADPQRSYFLHGATIIKNKGLCGFFDGINANALRTIGRHMWRNPILLATKEFFDQQLPEETQKKHPNLSRYLGMGAIIASDMALITPMEVVKTRQMTEGGTKSTGFLTLLKELPVKQLYKAAGIFGFRQSLYFGISTAGEEAAKAYVGKDQLSFKERTVSSFLSSIAYVTASMVPDVVKTRLQQHNSPYETVWEVLSDMGKVFKEQGMRAGLRGIGAGFFARVLLCTFSTAANFTIFNNTLAVNKKIEANKREEVKPRVSAVVPTLEEKESISPNIPTTNINKVFSNENENRRKSIGK